MVNSRFTSRPTTKKNSVMIASLTKWCIVADTWTSPIPISRGIDQNCS
jgi:hypothetical protein